MPSVLEIGNVNILNRRDQQWSLDNGQCFLTRRVKQNEAKIGSAIWFDLYTRVIHLKRSIVVNAYASELVIADHRYQARSRTKFGGSTAEISDDASRIFAD